MSLQSKWREILDILWQQGLLGDYSRKSKDLDQALSQLTEAILSDLPKKEKLAEQLHIWYLEAITSGVAGEQYNPNAVKEYKDLTEEQRSIDRYIAEAILNLITKKMGE